MTELLPKPTRTSYSALTTWEECPARYMYSYRMGLKSDPGPAAQRGTRLHTACERFLKGEIEAGQLSIDFHRIKNVLFTIRNLGAKAEEVWLCDEQGTLQPEEDLLTRFKAIVDIHYLVGDTLVVLDLKTGQPYEEHHDQLQSYALLGFSRYPEVERVEAAPLYLEGHGETKSYPRAMQPFLLDYWRSRWDKLFADDEYKPTPSPKSCKWCPYRNSKGGPCAYA